MIGRVSEEATRAISAPTIYVKLTPDIRDIDVIKRTRVTLLTITLRKSRAKSYIRFFRFTSVKALEGIWWLVKGEDLRKMKHNRP